MKRFLAAVLVVLYPTMVFSDFEQNLGNVKGLGQRKDLQKL